METRQTINEVRKYINKQKMPQEIKKIVEEIYREYEYAYREYLSELERIIENSARGLEELNNIGSYARREYEEDKATTNEMEELVFEAKINKIQEDILEKIRSESERAKNKKKLENLIPILNEGEIEQQEDGKFIRSDINFSRENYECALQIRESVVSEIESSKKNLIFRVTKNIPQSGENLDYINYAKRAFENEVDLILNKAKMQLPTKVKGELDLLDNKIVEDVINIYRKYNRNQEEIADTTTQRKEFADGLKVEVNVDETMQRMKEENTLRTPEESKKEGLQVGFLE